ncbi:MAG TPA: lipopolysaccharide biosynthesis protein [Gemmatimonadales bacterium]|nr:lipopolysaccharide biosynthesis protein [Gemmatimonadales bacterium]
MSDPTGGGRVSGPSSEFDDSLDGLTTQGAPPDLKQKTGASILWMIARTGSDFLLSFAIFALLARTLGPAAFGAFALAVAFAEFGRILPNTGLVSAISRARQVTPTMADTVFWSTLALAGVLAVGIALIARPLASAFGAPEVAPLLTALGCILPISAAGATHLALLLREFGHRVMATRSIASNLAGGGAALVAAWYGWGAWSLVVQRGVTEAVAALMVWRAYPWRPGRRYSRAVLRDVAGFSSSMTVTSVLFTVLVRLQDLVVGRMIGVAAVGVYRTAWRTVDLISQTAIMPFSQVSLPVLARLQDDLPGFAKAYLRIVRVSSALALPAIIGFAVLAPDAIALVFGSRWAASAGIARILGLMAVPFTLNYFAGPALAAVNRSGTLAWIAALQVALTAILTVLAAPYGLQAIASAYVLRGYLTLPVQMHALKRHTGVPYGPVLAAIAPALTTSIVMGGALLTLYQPLKARLESPLAFLVVMVGIGAAIYLGLLLLFARGFVRREVGDLRRLVTGPALSQAEA